MIEIALQFQRLALGGHDALMHGGVRKTRRAALEQAQHVVGPPAAVADVLAAEIRQAGDLVRVGARVGQDVLDFTRQFGRDALIGVDGQHPVARRQIQRAIFLRAETRPIGRDFNARTQGLGQFDGAVGAARIHHDEFVGEGYGLQAGGDVRRFVLGDDDD
ncbi:hypothetical protein D3C87_1672630 [compost metagenome]